VAALSDKSVLVALCTEWNALRVLRDRWPSQPAGEGASRDVAPLDACQRVEYIKAHEPAMHFAAVVRAFLQRVDINSLLDADDRARSVVRQHERKYAHDFFAHLKQCVSRRHVVFVARCD